MNAPSDDFEAELEAEIEAEIDLVVSSEPERATETPASEWLFDPVEAEQEEVELRGLLGAVEELEGD
ncbi:hypothetical protein GCM10022254_15760 [Actinomadura meridiana]|uniref:Uncharacterized protein n=1 Tax=Actinomadura meridiana TaxID=559626 RepID=A0ABP8BW91_9ACTN